MPETQLILNNLKAVKRSVKLWPEMVRVAGGRAIRSLYSPRFLGSLGENVCFETRPYRREVTVHEIDIVSPPDSHFMTTFFDVDPISPSGRFLAVTEVPFIWRIPYPGDIARVGVIDLKNGLYRSVYETQGWGSQLGANVQWGSSDRILYCNDVIDGRGTGVEIDLEDGEHRLLDGSIYGLDPQRRYSYSGNIKLINAGIPGYGVPVPLWKTPRPNSALAHDEGVWRTDLRSGKTQLLLSLDEIVAALPLQLVQRQGEHYVFNIKVSPDNQHLLIVIFARRVPGRGGWPVQLVTCRIDGSALKLAMPDSLWRVGGHHPNWTPDGQHIVMNLKLKAQKMAFVRFRPDGSDLTVLAPGHLGSGHPSIDPTGRWLLADTYIKDGFIDNKGEVPIRLINIEENFEEEIVRVYTNRINGPRRVDPHPVWASDGSIYFNGIQDGRRQVFRVRLNETGRSSAR